MSRDEFRVQQSSTGYRVELCRDGQPFVTFVDGLTKERAEREARALTALWLRIAPPNRRPSLSVAEKRELM